MPTSRASRRAARKLNRPWRVALVQSALPKYRLALFETLAKHPQVELTVFYGEEPDIPNVTPGEFRGIAQKQLALAGRRLFWHQAHFAAADPQRFDAAIFGWNTRYLSLAPALFRARRRQVATVLWGHGYSKTESGPRLLARSTLAKLGDAIMLYDQRAADDYIRRGFSPSRVCVAPNSIDQEPMLSAQTAWSKEPIALARFREEKQLTAGKILVYIGRPHQGRRLDVALHAVRQLSDPNLLFVIIGDSQNVPRLRELSERLGLTRQVRFVTGSYDEAYLAPWLMSAHALCCPSELGLSLHHAFAYQLPAIAGDNPSKHGPEIEALQHGTNGLLFRHNDANQLASRIAELFSDPDRLARLKLAAKATAQRHTLKHTVEGMVAAVRTALIAHPAHE